MILSHMINVGGDLLKCDMAETYHVYVVDWYDPPFPISYLSDLAAGLRENSRIRMKMSEHRLTIEQMLQALIADKLSTLIWQQTKDGHKGRNFPKSVYRILEGLDEKKKDDYESFETIEDFEAWYKETHHV